MHKLKTVDERVSAEREAHEDRNVLAESYRLKDRFSHIWKYPSRKRIDGWLNDYINGLGGKIVLDYGCGRGEASIKYLEHGATVYGIDIAQNYITQAMEAAVAAGYPKDRYRFVVMDAHKLKYAVNSFDVVIGNGILHHLSADIAMSEIFRVLRPGGRVLLFEPLAGNPLLKLFRWLTPGARTDDERPFAAKDVARLVDVEKWSVETIYCGVIEAPVAMFTSIILPKRPDNWLLRTADMFERWLHKRRLLLAWNQYILFNLVKKPIK